MKTHNQTDEELQKKQNNLIERNTKITIWIGVGAIIAQLLQTLIDIILLK